MSAIISYFQTILQNRSTQLALGNAVLAIATTLFPAWASVFVQVGVLLNAVVAAVPDHVGIATNAVKSE